MGLIKTGLKAAVAVKTADVIHERIQRRQQEQWAAYGHQPVAMATAGAALAPGVPAAVAVPSGPATAAEAAPVPPPAPAAVAPAVAPAAPDTATMLAQLKQLGELRDAGVLTDAEFEVQKARILTG